MQVVRPIQRVGLTGGIGSGKSTVSHILVSCGAALIDADAISRQATAAGGSAIAAIAKQFGRGAVNSHGAMDRDFMRQMVFNNPETRAKLEAIVHPLVGLETKRQADAARQAGSACIVFDIPLLVESGRWRSQLDQVLVVDCTEDTQIKRVMSRNAWARDTVAQVMAAQASRAQRLAAADICIHNDGLSLERLDQLVRRIAARFGL